MIHEKELKMIRKEENLPGSTEGNNEKLSQESSAQAENRTE
jgi:hypothetical protein